MCDKCVATALADYPVIEEQAHQVGLSQEPSPPGSFVRRASPPGSFRGSVPARVAEPIIVRSLMELSLELFERFQDYDESGPNEYCRWCSTQGRYNSGTWTEPFQHAPECIVVKIREFLSYEALLRKQEEDLAHSEAEARHERLLNGEDISTF